MRRSAALKNTVALKAEVRLALTSRAIVDLSEGVTGEGFITLQVHANPASLSRQIVPIKVSSARQKRTKTLECFAVRQNASTSPTLVLAARRRRCAFRR